MYKNNFSVAAYSNGEQDAVAEDRNGESSPLNVSTETTKDEEIDWKACFLPFFFPALGGLLFGYDIGGTSGALVLLKDALLSGTSWYNLSPLQTGLVVSGSLGGALAGSVLAFYVADFLGRRRELIVAAGLYLLGSLTMATAPSLDVLILGRLIFGLGIGLAMHSAPMYIAETSPSSIRGTLISLKEGFIVAGILLGYASGSFFVDSIGGWRNIFLLSLPVALAMASGMFFLPPSPRWLLLRAAKAEEAEEKGRLFQAAVESVDRLRGGKAGQKMGGEEEVRQMWEAEEEEEGAEGAEGGGGGGGFVELLKGANQRALLVGCGLVFFQQITGQPSVLYYATSILQEAGFAAASDATKVSVILGLFKLLMTGVAVFTVDKIGRRPLLLAGVSGIIVSLLTLGTFYGTAGGSPLVSVLALLLYVGAYQVSFGPISWLVMSEVFPLKVRGRAQSLATLVNFGSNAVVTFSLAPLQVALGQQGTFFAFASVGVVALAFIATKVPETKGLSLEEIQSKLNA